jgi:transposase
MPDAYRPQRASFDVLVVAGDVRHGGVQAVATVARLAGGNPVSQLLAEVPGIGPITALSLALTIDPGRFQSGRHFAAWLGLVPKEHSTGGR